MSIDMSKPFEALIRTLMAPLVVAGNFLNILSSDLMVIVSETTYILADIAGDLSDVLGGLFPIILITGLVPIIYHLFKAMIGGLFEEITNTSDSRRARPQRKSITYIHRLDSNSLYQQVRCKETDQFVQFKNRGTEYLVLKTVPPKIDERGDRHFFIMGEDLQAFNYKTGKVFFEQKTPPKPPEPKFTDRTVFFCQMDNDKHPETENAYQCEGCLRFVCIECYPVMKKQGLNVCPYCQNKLRLLEGNQCLSEPFVIKGAMT